jgi:hypothetical protein
LKAFWKGKTDSDSKYLTKLYEPCKDMDQCLLEIKNNDKLAVAISLQHARNARIPLEEEEMFCFEKENNVFSFSVVMLLKKDHHLLPVINTLIRRIAESGFILKWKADLEFKKKKADVKVDSHENAKPLKLSHLLGVYGILIAGILIALVGFIYEWTIFFFAQKKKIKFFIKLEKKFMQPFVKEKKVLFKKRTQKFL